MEPRLQPGHENDDAVQRPPTGREPDFPGAAEAASGGGNMFAGTCPNCGAAAAVDSRVPLKRQYCRLCGRSLHKLIKRKKHLAPANLTEDGLLKGRSRERVWMPMTGVALAAAGAAIFALWMWYRPQPVTSAPAMPGAREELGDVRAVVEKFTAARSAEELIPLLRDGPIHGDAVRNWFAGHTGSQPLAGSLLSVSTKQAGAARIAEAGVHFEEFSPMNLLCVSTPEGWKVDWRAFTGVGEMSVTDFMLKKPAEPVLLFAVVRASDYYNGAYSDAGLWQCLHLSEMGGEQFFFAYVARGNRAVLEKTGRLELPRVPKAAEINRVSRSLALRVRWRSGAGTNPLQAEVDSVVGEGWFIP